MTLEVIEQLVTRLGWRETVTAVALLEKGFSTDRKYLLLVGEEPRYLLRVSALAQAERRREEFSLLEKLAHHGLACSPPHQFGTWPQQGICFSLLGYLPGDSADEVLPTLPAETQCAIGSQAGRELRRLHQALPAPEFDWATLRGNKYDRLRALAEQQGLTFPGQQAVEAYIERHRHLLCDRPVTFQHDDYHPGNLIIAEGRFAGVIDFNRCDWGDPEHDFYKLALFSVPLSPAFARGQVAGYYPDGLPTDFWPRYTLYVCMSFHADLVWTQRFFPHLLDASHQRIQEVLSTLDLATGNAPTWYTGHP